MADRVEGTLSFIPIVTIADDTDADGRDTIHHDIKKALGGKLTYNLTSDNEGDKWYYAPNVIVVKATNKVFICNLEDDETELVGATGDPSNPNEAAGTAAHFTEGGDIDGDADKVRFLFIKNTGTSDANGTPTTNAVYFNIDGGSSSYIDTASMEIAPGESVMLKLSGGVEVENIVGITGLPSSAGQAVLVNGSDSVRVTIVAVINDAALP